jgi:hypothetical protein
VRRSPLRGRIPDTSRTDETTIENVRNDEPVVELWVDDHQEYEPGVVHGHLRHARTPIDPQPGDYLVVGDDDAPPVLAEVLGREAGGELLLRLLPGKPEARPEFASRRMRTVA